MAEHQPTNEQWLPIPGYEGRYAVSDQGRVKSLERKTWFVNRWGDETQRVVPEKIRSTATHTNGGHQYVTLHLDGVRKQWFVHALVLLAFHGARPDALAEIRHLDGNPENNRLDNLAYGTHQDNVDDMAKHGTHRNARKTECDYGHPFNEGNTYVRPDGKGRSCRTCMRDNSRKNGARYQRNYRQRQRETPK